MALSFLKKNLTSKCTPQRPVIGSQQSLEHFSTVYLKVRTCYYLFACFTTISVSFSHQAVRCRRKRGSSHHGSVHAKGHNPAVVALQCKPTEPAELSWLSTQGKGFPAVNCSVCSDATRAGAWSIKGMFSKHIEHHQWKRVGRSGRSSDVRN